MSDEADVAAGVDRSANHRVEWPGSVEIFDTTLRAGPAPFDPVHAELVELSGHLEFVVDRQRDAALPRAPPRPPRRRFLPASM